MVFPYPQFKHSLIPQAHSPEEDLILARETKNFRASLFQLLQKKVAEITPNYSEIDNQEQLYRKIRQDLDISPEVQKANKNRSVLQDRLWETVSLAIKSDRQRLEKEYKALNQIKDKGEIELNSKLKLPAHQLKTNIHRMPGGYLQDKGNDDFELGVMYDHGVFLYGQGWLGSLNDELGYTLIHNILDKNYPDFQPHHILDMGCSVGHSTLAYADKYPEAEIWGIDLGASLLRYANARAKALDFKVNFAQQNAENTDFKDNSFDLVVSHILLHEIPNIARKRVFAESYRLLKPGGVMIHLESKLFLSPPNLVSRYFRDTEVLVNSEPFLGSSKFEDFPRYANMAGFHTEDFKICYAPGYYAQQQGNNNPGWVGFCAVKR